MTEGMNKGVAEIWRHKEDHSVEFECRETVDSEGTAGYECMRTLPGGVLGFAEKNLWESVYERKPLNDE